MPSRICSILDCGRVHFSKGLCERHYRKAVRAKKRASSKVSVQQSAGNQPNKEVKSSVPRPTEGGGGVIARSSTSAPPLSEPSRSHTYGHVRPALSALTGSDNASKGARLCLWGRFLWA